MVVWASVESIACIILGICKLDSNFISQHWGTNIAAGYSAVFKMRRNNMKSLKFNLIEVRQS